MKHVDCKKDAIVELNTAILIAGYFDIRNAASLIVTEIYLHDPSSNRGINAENLNYYCTHCNKKVEIKELGTYCSYCNEITEVSKLFIVDGTSGIYCKGCVKDKDIKVSVIESFKKIIIK